MKVSIIGEVPTSYQLQSLRRFGLPIKNHLDGTYTVGEKFNSVREAKNYLFKRAEMYYNDPKDLTEAKKDIKKHSVLQLDAAQVKIIKS